MRDGGRAGCVVRDHEIYAPIYQVGRFRDPSYVRNIAKKCRDCAAPTCQQACPARVDIPGFVTAIADGQERRAYEILRSANPLPEICAYACPAEVLCEGSCIQQYIGDGAVPIRALQRYVCEQARQKGWVKVNLPPEDSGLQVAVIGAGPAGLACAIQLLELGHQVTIFDAADQPGGTAREVIPPERLDNATIRTELNALLDKVPDDRLQWRLSTALHKSYTLDDVLAEGFAAAFLAVGLPRAVKLPGAERPESGVLSATDFLKKIKAGCRLEVPAQVAVLGGGNTAVDAAIAAKQAGARDVYLLYRRSFAQMPAWPGEREAALDAGVHFLVLTQPLGYITDGQGRLSGVKVVSTTLGEPDDSGRRRPEIVEGTERILEVRLVIEALGEAVAEELMAWAPGVELSDDGTVAVDPETHQTSRAEVFAGGDVVRGASTVVAAVADGVEAAHAIDSWLRRRSNLS